MFLESSNLSFPTNSSIAQMVEADALEASQYRFESDWGYKNNNVSWCNGSTKAFDVFGRGSNPRETTKTKQK